MTKGIYGIIGGVIPWGAYYFSGGCFERNPQLGVVTVFSFATFLLGIFFYNLNEEEKEIKNRKNN